MALYVVTAFAPDMGAQDAIFVGADTPEEAACEGRFELVGASRGTSGDHDPDYATTVHVARVTRPVWMVRSDDMVRVPAAVACCGGLAPDHPLRHTMTCPTAPEDEKGWPGRTE